MPQTRNNANDAKKTDEEHEWQQYKEETERRFKSLEEDLRAMKTESDSRHAELMNLLLQLKNPTPPPTIPTPTMPPPTVITPPQPLPPFQPSFIAATFATSPFSTATTLQPAFQSSNLVFDEHGYPIPRFSESSSANRYKNQGFPSATVTSGFPFGHFGQPTFVTDHGRGSGPAGERIWTPGADYRLRKLKMPLFDGEDAYGWVYRMERFFDIQGFTTMGERLRAAVLCMEGPALSWYRWTDHREPFRSWEQLKLQLLDRFQPSQNGDLYEQFLNIRQEGTAREYVAQFETLAAQLDCLSEKVLEGTFIKGLKQELRTSVRLLQPTGLNQAIKLALMVDESNPDSRGESEKGSTKGPLVRTGGGGSRLPIAHAAGGARPITGEVEQPFKRLTDTEYTEKRAKGLCFRCDGKFAPGHRCPEKTLQVLLVPDNEEEEATWEEFEHPPP